MQDTGARTIPLTRGYVALVDEADFRLVGSFKWCVTSEQRGTVYASSDTGGVHTLMHRLITSAPRGVLVDHRDRNGLNNCRSNLRYATYSQNACNSVKRRNSLSRFRGVTFFRPTGKWAASIALSGIRHHLGHFVAEEDAARAYDEAAVRLHGEFARLNFPSEVSA